MAPTVIVVAIAAAVTVAMPTSGATVAARTPPTVVVVHYARAEGEAAKNEQRKNATKQERNHDEEVCWKGKRIARIYLPKRRPCQSR